MPSINFATVGTIARREIRSFFNSPVAYVVIIVFLAILGWFFTSNLFLANVASVRVVFELVPFLFLFFVPAITMRLFAEERKTGTLELLTTKPVRDVEIVLAKFLAALALLAAALLPTLVYLVTVAILGKPDLGPAFTGYLGLLLMGAVFIGFGIFASSLTDNQIVAFILAFLFVFVFFMFDKVLMYAPAWLAGVLEFLSVDSHFAAMTRGVVDSRNLVYFASVIGFTLYLTTLSLERRKW